MKFINIYKKEQEIGLYCMDKVILTQVVGINKLSDEDFDNLADYFEEVTMVADYREIGKMATFEIVNKNGILENCPIVKDKLHCGTTFEKTTYVVVMGTKSNYGSGEVVVSIKV